MSTTRKEKKNKIKTWFGILLIESNAFLEKVTFFLGKIFFSPSKHRICEQVARLYVVRI